MQARGIRTTSSEMLTTNIDRCGIVLTMMRSRILIIHV